MRDAKVGPLRASCCASVIQLVCPADSSCAMTALTSGCVSALMSQSSCRTGVPYGLSHADAGCAATVPPVAETAWQPAADTAVDAGHVPSAGPLVLLGIAALVCSARRSGAAQPRDATGMA